jgi:hypothetical protein
MNLPRIGEARRPWRTIPCDRATWKLEIRERYDDLPFHITFSVPRGTLRQRWPADRIPSALTSLPADATASVTTGEDLPI